MQQGSPSDRDVRKAEEAYSALRAKDREAWRTSKGRR
jgi:hypothetical protein